jgi:CTP:molybdopterin cytidylyltransferase MocA
LDLAATETVHGVAVLLALAAAFCVNSVVDVEAYLAAAKAGGVTDRQVGMAISIARAVRRTAADKVEGVVRWLGDDGAGTTVCGSSRA